MKIFCFFIFMTSQILSQIITIDPNPQNMANYTQIDQALVEILANPNYQNSTLLFKNSSSSYISWNQFFKVTKNITLMYF